MSLTMTKSVRESLIKKFHSVCIQFCPPLNQMSLVSQTMKITAAPQHQFLQMKQRQLLNLYVPTTICGIINTIKDQTMTLKTGVKIVYILVYFSYYV